MQLDDFYPDRQPVDRVAARVVLWKGAEYVPKKNITNHDSVNPLPVRAISTINGPEFQDLTGASFGRFTVIGLARDFNKQWVVRCKCGRYSTRHSKAIKNPRNKADRCEHCRHLAYLQRHYGIYGGKNHAMR